LCDLITEQIDHQIHRFGPLDLHRGYVNFLDVHVESSTNVDALQPQLKVRIGNGEPKFVFCHTQQHRIIENPAAFIAQNHIPCSHHGNLGGVSGDNKIDESFSIGALDLD